MAELGAGKIV